MDCLFADGIMNISMAGGVVRIDYGRAAPVPPGTSGQQALKLEPSHQLVMPLEGFMRALGAQRQLVDQLAKAGAIRPAGAPKTPPAA